LKKPFELHADYQPDSFAFKDKKKVEELIALYPPGRQQSAVMPLLDLTQRQVAAEGAKSNPPYGGWIPRAAMDHIAEILSMPPMKVYEVASFYSMYNMAPVGKYLVQLCTTTPCWLRDSTAVLEAAKVHLGIGIGETTDDGMFSMMEVECLGACVNAPICQINDDMYEDLTGEQMVKVLKALQAGERPPYGTQITRQKSAPEGGPKSLTELTFAED